jgi:transposase-like protein
MLSTVVIPPACPFCGSDGAARVGQWGGQIITAQWRCNDCNSYFEAVRDDFADEQVIAQGVPERRV